MNHPQSNKVKSTIVSFANISNNPCMYLCIYECRTPELFYLPLQLQLWLHLNEQQQCSHKTKIVKKGSNFPFAIMTTTMSSYQSHHDLKLCSHHEFHYTRENSFALVKLSPSPGGRRVWMLCVWLRKWVKHVSSSTTPSAKDAAISDSNMTNSSAMDFAV